MPNRQIFPWIWEGSQVNAVTAILTFVNPDAPEDTTASVTLTGLSWVAATSVIIAGLGGITSDPVPDHGPDDAQVEGITVYVENIVPGVGFDITGYAPRGTWGQYLVYAIGVV